MNSNKYIVSRDYLTVKIWDICNNKKPLNTFLIQENLKSKLCEMIENEAIFDKFKVSVSPDSNSIITGNYNNNFHLIDVDGTNTQYEVNYKKATTSRPIVKGSNTPIAKMDYEKKLLACDFNPKKNIMAVASLNCFFTYAMWLTYTSIHIHSYLTHILSTIIMEYINSTHIYSLIGRMKTRWSDMIIDRGDCSWGSSHRFNEVIIDYDKFIQILL